MRARSFFEGCGIGIAVTLNYTWGHLSPRRIDDLYLRELPVTSVIGGATVDLLAMSAVGVALIVLLERFDREYRTAAWAAVAALIPAIVVRTVYVITDQVNHSLSSAMLFLIVFLPLLALCLLGSKAYRIAIAGFRWALLGLGVCILWMTPRLAYMIAARQPQDAMAFHRALPAGGKQTGPRVVWILLDELSFDQTFDHRQPGLSLPNFDALRATSTSFRNVEPAGYYTDEIVPAVLRGKAVEGLESSTDGVLFVQSRHDSGWERYDPQATVFGDARGLGWTTGIAGWYNPYCRTFASMLDSCAWIPESETFHGHMSGHNTILQNALAPLRSKAGTARDRSEFDEHLAAYPVLMNRSLALVQDASIRFVFLHLSVPHPPSIYDRRSHSLRSGGSYLDNLALADQALGELRAAIEGTPAARTTTLVVSSDHSMRVLKWRNGHSWTEEDERVFHARFDPRPVLMIHFAGESDGREVASVFDELRTRDVLKAILAEKVKDAMDLERWLAANGGVR